MSTTKTPRERISQLQKNMQTEESNLEQVTDKAIIALIKRERNKEWRLEQKDENDKPILKKVKDLSMDELRAAIIRTRNMREIKGKFYWELALQLELRVRKGVEDVLSTDPLYQRADKLIEDQIAAEVASAQ